jgi:DNA-binding MarR family transcriptional regulator/GNAT superfamily N-acetyltransferase
MAHPTSDRRVAAVRRFNRFYTQQIGVLNEQLLNSHLSLTEARVLYELAHRQEPRAGAIAKGLGLDPGYLSRLLRGLTKRGLISTKASEGDRRERVLSLTKKGREAFARLDAWAHEQVAGMLSPMSPDTQRDVVDAMERIRHALVGPSHQQSDLAPPYLLRSHRPGDMGWVVHRHAVLYAEEYGWDEHLEALAARVVADFIEQFDPERERCWIAERDGEILGCVFLVKHPAEPETVAKLRLLLVEPAARGLGLGTRLVEECIRFAREAGYRKITLWTNSVLHAARRIYERAGFRLIREEAHRSYGVELVGQTWELDLTARAPDRSVPVPPAGAPEPGPTAARRDEGSRTPARRRAFR